MRSTDPLHLDTLRDELFSNEHLLIAHLDLDFNFIRVNRAYASADDREPEFYPGKNHFDLYPNEDNERIFRRVVRSGRSFTSYAKPFEYEANKERGTSYWDWTLRPLKDEHGSPTTLLLTLVDVTDRIKAEEARWKSESLLRSVAENSPDHILNLGTDLTIRYANRPSPGLTLEEIVGRSILDFLPAEDRERVRGILQKVVKTGHVERYDTEYRTADGAVIDYESIAAPLRNADVITGITLIARDVSERKRGEAEIRRAREFSQALYDASADMLFVYGPDGRLIDVNDKTVEVYGYALEEIRDLDPRLLMGEDCRVEEVMDKLRRARNGESLEFEWVARDRAGRTFPVEIRLRRIGKSSNVLAQVRDLTETKRKEEERLLLERDLRQSQKMQAVGTLAGGIAHDFNNILTAIIGYSEMIRDALPDDSDAYADIIEVLKGSDRARELTHQILLFTRKQEAKFQPFRLTAVTREALKLFKATTPRSVKIVEDLRADPDRVNGNPTQILQVLVNLLTNAEFAMRDQGGRLSVSLENVAIDAQQANAGRLNVQAGDYLLLTVEDNGAGMSEEVAERVFEPFFTTKPPGEGSGMGLSTSHGIVTAHKGAITFETHLGRGTSFYVYLPLSDAPDRETKVDEGDRVGGSERLLLVDDEPSVAHVMYRILSGLGYEVSAFTDPEQALARFSRNPRSFDALITDQTMPAISGIELIHAVRRIRSDLPIILCTGYSRVANEAEARKAGANAFLEKPYSSKVVSRVVRAALDSKPARAGDSSGPRPKSRR